MEARRTKERGLNEAGTEAIKKPGPSALHELVFVGIICAAQLCTQIGLGQTISIIHEIGRTFDLHDAGQLSWLIAGYSLTVGTFILFSGRLGDAYGYKRMLTIGYSWFAIWSLVAGLSAFSNHVLFVFARVLQGIGPAICLPNGLAVLGSLYAPGRKKALVFSAFAAMAPCGGVVGATFAGIFALTYWPRAYWAFAIALAGLAVGSHLLIPDPEVKAHEVSLVQDLPLHQLLDLPGGLLGILSLVLFNFAWNQAPLAGWQSPYVIVALVLGILLGVAFFINELEYAKAPLIPFGALKADVPFVLAAIACGWSCFGIWMFYTWQVIEVLQDAPPLLASAYNAPTVVAGLAAALMTGPLLRRFGPALVMTLSLCCFLCGIVLVGTRPVGQIYWTQLFLSQIITPVGMDMSFPAATMILSDAVPREQQGIAASLVNTVVNYSISLGLGLAGTVEVSINNGGKTKVDIEKGYREAYYVGMGLAAMGVVICMAFVGRSLLHQSVRRSTTVDA